MGMAVTEEAALEVLGLDGVPDFSSVDSLTALRRRMADLNDHLQSQVVARYVLPRLLDYGVQNYDHLSDRELEMACDTAKGLIMSCMETLSATELFGDMQAVILVVMQNGPQLLKETILKQIEKKVMSESGSSVSLLTGDSVAVCVAVVRQLRVLSVSSAARLVVLAVCRVEEDAAHRLLTHAVIRTEFHSQLQSPDTQSRFRLHDLTADLVRVSDRALCACSENGLLSGLIDELDRDDVLGQLNGLELLAQMTADSESTAEHLHDLGVIPRLHNMLDVIVHRPDAGFLFPAVIRFFGYLARARPASCLRTYPKFLQSVFDLVLHFDRLDVTQRLLGFDTLGIVGSTDEGKMQLANLSGDYAKVMEEAMRAFGRAVTDGPLEMRARHLQALAMLLSLPTSSHTDQLLSLTKQWFQWLADDPTSLIVNYFKQPFPDVRVAAGEIVLDLAKQPWGQKMLAQQPGFVEFLLDRSTEREAVGRRLKYDVVCALAQSETVDEAFEAADVLKLRLYERQGAFYVQTETQVATEGAD